MTDKTVENKIIKKAKRIVKILNLAKDEEPNYDNIEEVKDFIAWYEFYN